jgi:PAS domain S-box-containing protein
MVHPPERREEAGFIIGEMLAGRADFCPVPVMTKAGQQIPVETKVTRGLWDGKPAIFGVTKDISALKFSEEKFSRIFQSSSALIVLSRCEDDCIIDVNGTFLNTLGYVREDVIGKTFAELRIYADGGRQGEIDEVLKLNGAVKNLEMAMRAKDGAMKDCLLSAETIYVGTDRCLLSILVDITDRRRLEEEREKVARLESVGQLAAGVAHDFNNILTAVLGNINLARLDAIPGSSLQGALERAEEASLRAKTITARLLTFSRGGAPVKKIAHVNDLLRNTANLALSGSNVKCLFSIPDDLWRAEIDESQVGQVLHNLVVNAQQAMPGSGNIELIATNMTLSKNQSLAEKLPLKPGDFIRIDVRDHGTGISAEDVGKIFDPFFTTTPGHSGLGLTAAFSIVRQHGGHISVETELGRGSTFHVYLPAFTRSAAPAQAGKAAARHESQARILVMDDEKTVREITGRMIRHAGYENVELSADGREALKLYKAALEAGEPFSLVILDLTVPGAMGGQETIGELLKVDPGVNAVVSSGYADDPVIAGYREYGFSGAIVKPFTLEDLRQVLRDVIG